MSPWTQCHRGHSVTDAVASRLKNPESDDDVKNRVNLMTEGGYDVDTVETLQTAVYVPVPRELRDELDIPVPLR